MSGKYRKEHNCLNCGFHVEEHYCSRCGQPNLELDENFWAFITHSIAHYFHFDNKFFQTLLPLLTKPGKVTLDYLAGKRARYINPVSMYIFVSIVYFIVAPPAKKKRTSNEKSIHTTEQRAAIDTVKQTLAEVGIDTSRMASKTESIISSNLNRALFKKMSFNDQKIILDQLKAKQKVEPSEDNEKQIKKYEELHAQKNDSTYAAYLARQQTLPEDQKDNFIERYMIKRSFEISQKSDVLEEQVERNRSKQYFLFMPLMALFVMLNFRKNHIRYLDHLIFTIHGMTAFFIVLSVVQPLKRLLFGNSQTLSGILEVGLLVWICWYLYQSLKTFYQRKPSTTFWRMVWIVLLYGTTLKFAESVMRNILFYLS